MIEYIFLLILLISIIGLIIGLIKPTMVKMTSRKSSSIIFGIAIIVSFIFLTITIPPVTKSSSTLEKKSSQEQSSSLNSTGTGKEENIEIADSEIIDNTATQQTVVDLKENTSTEPINQNSSTSNKIFYSVVKVVDGDTIDVSINGETKRLRLIGINTPETVDPRTAVQCFGKEASDKAKELLTGKKVSLEADSTQGELDKYSRLLRYVFLEDGTNFNLYMIREGYAYEYTYSTPYKYQTEFKAAQVYAKANNKGLWSPNACNGELTAVMQSQTQSSSTSATTQTAFGACGTKKTCTQMTSCEEAKYFLNMCGVTKLDGDSDGTPCEALCFD